MLLQLQEEKRMNTGSQVCRVADTDVCTVSGMLPVPKARNYFTILNNDWSEGCR